MKAARGYEKGEQRQRLLAAIVDVASEHGYEATTVARVITRAGVSRATFYEHFAGKHDCVLGAIEEVEGQLLAQVRASVRQHTPEQAAAAGVGAMLTFAESEPAKAALLMGEALAGGPRMLDARDHGVLEIARVIEHAYANAGPSAAIPDISPIALVGGVQRMLAARLGRGEYEPAALEQALVRWLERYRAPVGQHRWRGLTPHVPPPRSPWLPASPLRAPPALAPGRPREPPAAVAEIHRQRILFAAAEILQARGHAAVSVAEITSRAGVDGRVFYSIFADKRDVLSAVHELTFQHTMAITASAFFTTASWPERVWEAGRVLTQYLEQNPVITRAALLDSYAGTRTQVQRVEDLTAAFTIFLQEGYQDAAGVPAPCAAELEAVARVAFEIGYRHAREAQIARLDGLTGLLGHLTHMCLAPFLGARAANEQIDTLMARNHSSRGADEHARGRRTGL